jgi:hypothetical protein
LFGSVATSEVFAYRTGEANGAALRERKQP